MSNKKSLRLRVFCRPLAGAAAGIAGLLLAAAVLPQFVNPDQPAPGGAVQRAAPHTPGQTLRLTGSSETVVRALLADGAPQQAAPPHPKQRPEALPVAALTISYGDFQLLNLPAVRAGAAPVARTNYTALPDGYHDIASVEQRKSAFFSVVLPLVLIANEEILADRRRLSHAYAIIRTGGELSRRDAAWVRRLAARYETDPADIDELLMRVDIVPPALALAQAAEESGWGSSRFARQGNALFGEWTWTEGEGIVPTGRPAGATYAVKAFDSLLDSVRSYTGNLNTNAAYADLRALRAAMRTEAEDLDAARLAGTLVRYSQRGQDYVQSLRTIIRANDLDAFKTAKLTGA